MYSSEHTLPPNSVLGGIRDSVPRAWLVEKIEAALTRASTADRPNGSIILVVGAPGTGKTILAAQLAAAWNCPWQALRVGSTAGVIWKDARTAFVSLGLQLRALYGPNIFGEPIVEVHAKIDAKEVRPSGRIAGAEIGSVTLSPFRRALIEVDVAIGELAGEAFGIRIAELKDVTESMTVPRLVREAIIEPLNRLATMQPTERVRLIVDALDGNPEVADCIPLGDEMPPNASWVLTSQDGDHLARFVAGTGTSVVRIELSELECKNHSIEDGETYARARLESPPLTHLLATAPTIVRPVREIARDLAQASGGNFLYLRYLVDGIESDATQARFDLLTRSVSDLPEGLEGIYRYFVVERLRAEVGSERWTKVFVPVLGILAVASAPLTAGQLAAFAGSDLLLVDEVVGSVRSFLETIRIADDATFQFYHRSFADFLLTQDRSRNPYPLRSAGHYHAMMADFYASRTEPDWAHSDDSYALVHLPIHLRESNRIPQLLHLLCGAFLRRRIALYGLGSARSECAISARAAALAWADEAFLQLLELSTDAEREFREEWETGRDALSLLIDEEAAIQERARGPSTSFLPWSALLVAERRILTPLQQRTQSLMPSR